MPFRGDDEGVDPAEVLEAWKADAERKVFFAAALMNPTFHWFFAQGQEALEADLYAPGVSSLLIGIEASLRVTLAELEPGFDGDLALSPYQLLSNTLLRKGRDLGVPVDVLAFPNEKDFLAQLDTKENVQIVQLRHDICHGNILRFVQRMDFDRVEILTPECLRRTAAQLLSLSYQWATGLAKYRGANGRRPKDAPIPESPKNPLAEWLG